MIIFSSKIVLYYDQLSVAVLTRDQLVICFKDYPKFKIDVTINVHIVLLNNCIWMERLIWMTLVQLNLVLFNPVEGCSLAGWCWAYTHTHSAPIIVLS